MERRAPRRGAAARDGAVPEQCSGHGECGGDNAYACEAGYDVVADCRSLAAACSSEAPTTHTLGSVSYALPSLFQARLPKAPLSIAYCLF